jgi:hypothetical protein
VTVTVISGPVVDRSRDLLRGARHAAAGYRFGVPQHAVITAEDIAEGQRGNGTACALARVLHRLYPGQEFDISGEQPTRNGQPLIIAREVAEWIGRYDRGEPAEPLTIEIYT